MNIILCTIFLDQEPPSVMDLMNNRTVLREICSLMDVSAACTQSGWKGLGNFLKDHKYLYITDVNLLEHYYGNAGEIGYHFLYKLYTTKLITVKEFTEVARKLERIDIVFKLDKNCAGIEYLKDVSKENLQDIGNDLQTKMLVSNWEDFAEEFGFNFNARKVIEAAAKDNNKGTPSQELFKLLQEQNPKLQLNVVIEGLRSFRRNDVALALSENLNRLKLSSTQSENGYGDSVIAQSDNIDETTVGYAVSGKQNSWDEM